MSEERASGFASRVVGQYQRSLRVVVGASLSAGQVSTGRVHEAVFGSRIRYDPQDACPSADDRPRLGPGSTGPSALSFLLIDHREEWPSFDLSAE